MRDDVLIRVLGPVDLVTPDGPLTLGSRNLRALLASLAVAVGHAVPADQLRTVLWGTHPPRSADGSLHTYVSRLRHLLGTGAVERSDHSYRLAVPPESIDAVRFERMVRTAVDATDPVLRSATSRQALALWHGEPFGDLGDDDPFRLEAMRLDDLRLTATELALSSEIELGHHELAVAELEIAVEEHPFREHLWYLLVDALRRDGRRIEALRACDRWRRTLADVGLTPAADLVRLEQLVLDRDHDDPTSAAGDPPPSTPEERASLRRGG